MIKYWVLNPLHIQWTGKQQKNYFGKLLTLSAFLTWVESGINLNATPSSFSWKTCKTHQIINQIHKATARAPETKKQSLLQTLFRATATTLEPCRIPGSINFICSRSVSASSFLRQNNPRDFPVLTPETNTNSSEELLRAYTGTPANRSSIALAGMPPPSPRIRAQTGAFPGHRRARLAWFWRLEMVDSKWVLGSNGRLGKWLRKAEQWFWMSVRACWRLSCGGFDAEGVSRCLGLRKFMFLFPTFSQKIWVREFEGGGVSPGKWRGKQPRI